MLSHLWRDPQPDRGRIETASTKRIDGQLCDGAAKTHFSEEAFDQIMADVDAPTEIIAVVRPYFAAAHRSCSPDREIAVLNEAFRARDWGEAWFDAWRGRFMAIGAFPLMWRVKARTLIDDMPSPPCDISSAFEYLTVDDIRKLLSGLGYMIETQRPCRRAAMENLLQETDTTGAIIKAALPHYEAARVDRSETRQHQKCEILAHTISMRALALQDRHVRSQPHNRLLEDQEFQLRPKPGDCPVEIAFAAKFMAGEIDGVPPFFPGDRTRLIVTWNSGDRQKTETKW